MDKYRASVDYVRELQVPSIGASVARLGDTVGEKASLLGASALNAFAWFRLPSFNWTWIAGDRTVNNFFTFAEQRDDGAGERVVREEKVVVKERVTVVHDWSQADLTPLRDELKKELKAYVDGLMASERERRQAEDNERRGETRELSPEEIERVLNVLLDRLKTGEYFKLDLTEENFRAIFVDMRKRFLEDNREFVAQLVSSVQGSLDWSAWDEKLRELREQILGTRGELSTVRVEVERLRATDLAREGDAETLKESLMAYINEVLKQRVTEVVEIHVRREREQQQQLPVHEQGKREEMLQDSLANEDEVRRLIQGALKVYDADKTGLADYALESAGGQVLSTRCTENYHTKSAQISVFGIPLWYPRNTPRTAIQPNVLPGNCWAFQGFPGFLVLELNMEIFVTGFTMEHIPKSLSNGQIESAPKGFSVWGLENENDQEPVRFGDYEYSDADEASSYQYFAVEEARERKYRIVELRIESNHGQPNYTCLYRFRVHGSPI